MDILGKLIAIVAAICIVAWIEGAKWVTVVVVVAVALIAWAAVQARQSQRDSRRKLIVEHIVELSRKRRQLCFDAGYGVTDQSKWKKEMRVFIRNVLQVPTTGKQMQNQVEQIMTEIDAFVLAYDEASGRQSTGYLSDMSGTEYEAFCATVLRSLGFKVELTAATGDQGADIVATRAGERFVLQCKHYSGTVGNAAIQEVLAARTFYDADHAVVVSNAQFTVAARQLASKGDVHLLHHDDLSFLASDVPGVGTHQAGATA
jgi:restriction system protein